MEERKAVAGDKLADVESKLAELSRLGVGLQTLMNAFPGHSALAQCPIFHALREETA